MSAESPRRILQVERLGSQEKIALVDDVLNRGVDQIVENWHGEMRHRLLTEKLRIKFGTDPSSPNIHFGRAVSLMKLRDMQRLGHQVVLIIGDFTGEIGDTSDKESGRPMISREQVTANMTTYVQQVGKVLDMSQVELHYNSQWLDKLGLEKLSSLSDLFSVQEFISRDLIKRRLKTGQRVSLRELLYPIMQGYDSVEVRADFEIGGNDQLFNLLSGRTIQDYYGQPKQMLMLTNMITGTDGHRMSASVGNTINLHDKPDDIFGKVMSSKDELILEYFIHCTRVPLDEIEDIKNQLKSGRVNPRDIKMKLARAMTAQVYGPDVAVHAERNFQEVFQNKGIPENLPEIEIGESRSIVDVLVQSGMAKTKSEARRLISQKGVKVNSEVVDEGYLVDSKDVLQKGRRTFLRIK